jgi:hypothetical protein
MTYQTRFTDTGLKPCNRLAARADAERTRATAVSDAVRNLLADGAAGSGTMDCDEGMGRFIDAWRTR